MAEFKRRTLYLSTGKQIKLFGNSVAIGRSLEIGEGYAPNIFSFAEPVSGEKLNEEAGSETERSKTAKEKKEAKSNATVTNPHKLTKEEIWEIADFNIRLWMDLKDNIREYGASNPKIFNCESSK